jgi:predicted metal-dependent enzyme (double-stranded beta helix superfamily)
MLMRRFVGDLTALADRCPEPRRLAEESSSMLAQVLECDRLLEGSECQPDPRRYRQHILHVDPGGRFSVVSLVWLPGQCTPIHDHVAWCVSGVCAGTETEQRFEPLRDEDRRPSLLETATSVNAPGTVSCLPPLGRDIHRVWCGSDGPAISIHLYGADIARLGSSINVVYGQQWLRGAKV